MIIYNNHLRCRGLHIDLEELRAAIRACTRHFLFPAPLPMLVPSLSWQNEMHFQCKNGSKKTFFWFLRIPKTSSQCIENAFIIGSPDERKPNATSETFPFTICFIATFKMKRSPVSLQLLALYVCPELVLAKCQFFIVRALREKHRQIDRFASIAPRKYRPFRPLNQSRPENTPFLV